MSLDNRSLDGLDWQERKDGSWVVDTGRFKLVATAKDADALNAESSLKQYTHEPLLYRWDETENLWLLVDRNIFGSKGIVDAKLDAERMLARYIEKERQVH